MRFPWKQDDDKEGLVSFSFNFQFAGCVYGFVRMCSVIQKDIKKYSNLKSDIGTIIYLISTISN